MNGNGIIQEAHKAYFESLELVQEELFGNQCIMNLTSKHLFNIARVYDKLEQFR